MKTSYRRFIRVAAAALLLAAPGALLAQQTLAVSPASLSFSAQAGSSTPQNATVVVTSAGPQGTAVDYLAGATYSVGSGWLSVTPTSGKTPANLTVTVNPAGLATGTYAGSVVVAIGGTTQSVPVSLTVGQLGATPSSVSFNYLMGGLLPGSQVVQIAAQSQVAYNATVSTTTGANWLIVAPSAGTAPGSVSISLNPNVMPTLAQGNYSGTVTLTPTTGSTAPLNIPVTLSVSPTPQLTITPAALSFNYQIGGSNNQVQQTVSLASTGNPLSYGVTFNTSSGGPWLVVNPTVGVTPASLTVGVQPSALSPGTYQGTVTVVAQGAATPSQTINVTLTVSVNPLLSLSPNALEFTYQVGTPSPAAKTITPVSTSGALNYVVTAGVATPAGGNWLTIGTPAGTTPTEISISVNPAGLSAGTYTGTVTVTAAGAGNPPQTVPVTLKVSNDPLITVNKTVNPTTLTFNWQTGKVGPGAQVIELGTTTGAPLNYSVTSASTSGGDWLRIIPSGTATPATISVFASTSNISAGTYDGSITVTATNPATGEPAPNSPLIIPVKFIVSDNALLNVSKQSLSLTSVGGVVATDTISLTSTSDQLTFTVSFTTASGGNWLTLGPVSGSTPSVLTVSAVPSSLAPGTYAGSITITANGGQTVANSPIQIPVTLTVASGSLVVPTTPLNFNHPQGGTAPQQTVQISQSNAPMSFTASASTTSGGNWLSVAPSSGTTPATLSVAVTSSSLPQGTYDGSITIVSPGASNSPQVIPVRLTVATPQTLAVTPATLAFSFQVGMQTPNAQQVSVTSTGGPVGFNASASTRDGGNWLKLSGTSGQTSGVAGNLSVAVDPAGLAPGTYTGTISITSSSVSNSPQTVAVTLTVTAMPIPSGIAIANAASYASGAVAPGEIIVIGGQNMGVTTLTSGRINAAGNLDTTLADTQVLFDGVPAPIVYVSDRQLSAVVPYELAGRLSTRLQVAYKGAVSQPLELRVTESAPGIFTLNASGSGPGAILNQNGSVNTNANPAQKGAVVVIYATGEGATDPRGINGRITPLDPNALARPLLPVSVLIGGRQARVLYAGSAPGLVAGALQINAEIPADVASGALPVVVTVGSASSQANVTVAVQ